MKTMCLVLCIFLLFCLILSDDSLLKIGQNSQCIKQVINGFIKKQSCHHLAQSQKTFLAIKMTNCLNIKLGKNPIPQCLALKQCKIQGDDWDTFTTFFTHIDNLCHFYWNLLHHQRTQKLVGQLSNSAIESESILQKNYESTQKILQMQDKIKGFMQDAIHHNKNMTQTLINSESKIRNMTESIQSFIKNLNDKWLSEYAFLVNTVTNINKGIQGVNVVQGIMMSDIESLNGMLYFFVLFWMLIILTSFKALGNSRMGVFCLLVLNIGVQILMPSSLIWLIGVRMVRCIFVLCMVVLMVRQLVRRGKDKGDFNEVRSNKQSQSIIKSCDENEVKSYIDSRFDTTRIKRIFREILQQKQAA